jgi:hypothetical protein
MDTKTTGCRIELLWILNTKFLKENSLEGFFILREGVTIKQLRRMFKSAYSLQVLFSAFLVLIILGLASLIAGNILRETVLLDDLTQFIIIR